MKAFQWRSNPYFELKPGIRKNLSPLIHGKRLLIVTGAGWLKQSGEWDQIVSPLRDSGIEIKEVSIAREPSPEMIDQAVDLNRDFQPQSVLAIGGGSVLDAGKAIAAMFCHQGSVKDYLEGVGTREPQGATLPLTALPTTSGTGSEATKNAVISQPGVEGFKKSLRHNHFIPRNAVIDPELLLHCPRSITLYSGMDALTQLMEGWLSKRNNCFSDMTARHGLELFTAHFPRVLDNPDDISARAAVGLASYLSGMTLAHAGLGTVHGMAGALGGLTNLPHGMICSRLIPPVFQNFAEKAEDEDSLRRLSWLGDQFKLRWPKVTMSGIEGFFMGLEVIQSWMPANREIPERQIISLAAQAAGDKNSPVLTNAEERKGFFERAFNPEG